MGVSVYDLQGLKLFADVVDITQLQANGYYELNHHFANGTYIVETKVGSIETRKKLIVID